MSIGEPQLAYEAPTPVEYCGLRQAAGLSPMDGAAAATGLPASWCAVSLRVGDELVAMGRMVGDGALFLQVVDIAVRPDWQRRGLGRRVMAALMDEARRRAPRGVIVTLLADGEACRLYEQFGFRLSAPGSQGMLLRL